MKNERKIRVLFVCMGNICRSPAGENVFRALVEREGLEGRFMIDSAGTHGYHIGERADKRMRIALERRGLPTGGRARQFGSRDFVDFDVILAMDEDNLAMIRQVERGLSEDLKARRTARVVAFADFCRVSGATQVPDPYYGGKKGFERVIDLLEEGCEALLDELMGKR